MKRPAARSRAKRERLAAAPPPNSTAARKRRRPVPALQRLKSARRAVLAAGAALVLVSGGLAYYYLAAPNVKARADGEYLYVRTGADFDDVLAALKAQGALQNEHTFRVAAALLGYANSVHSGRYRLEPGQSNFRLLAKLRLGLQEPVKLRFTSARTLPALAEKLAKQIEPDEATLLAAMQDTSLLRELGVTRETLMSIFIPDTYEMYWNISAENFLRRMKREHENFWNEARLARAQEIGLTPAQVSVLASIVHAETYRDEEKPRIAGVYLNRLRNGWPLQADPTLIFAWNDFSIRRVLHKHREIDSPYNTYKYQGLPPGPINCPSPSSLNAALNFEQHDYYYFCARADGSGYHDFTTEDDYNGHLRNARRYHRSLNARASG